MLTAPRYTFTVRMFGGGGRMMARRCTRSALAGAALALFIALAGWLLPEATPAEATSFAADSVTIISSAGPDNTYGTGDIITLRVAFRVHFVTGHSGGALAIDVGGTTRSATPTIASGCSRNVDFSYRVVGGDRDTDGITVAANALSGTWTTNNHVSDCTLPAGIHNHNSPSIVAALTTPQAAHKVDAPFTDYDNNDNNLIDVTTLAQLNAIRHDLDGDGNPTAGGTTAYNTAFPDREAGATGRMGCPATCAGYELMDDLDFDTDGDDDVADAPYDNWTPIASYANTFQGNGHIIDNLTINDSTTGSGVLRLGLFDNINSSISGVGLPGASISSSHSGTLLMGPLAGNVLTAGSVTSSWATGSVMATDTGSGLKFIGGLVGHSEGPVRASYSAASVTATTAATAVSAGGLAGGLNLGSGTLTASYATGAVSGGTGSGSHVGGLVGQFRSNASSIIASYAAGTVTGGTGANVGGLVGSAGSGTITNSYWDVTASGVADDADSPAGVGKTTSELQTPTAYGTTGIYSGGSVPF